MKNIFNAGNYGWALFIGHLVIEKVLKALWIRNNHQNYPPKTHNLLRLAEEASYPLTEKDKIFLNRVNGFHLEARYPDYKFEFYKECTREFAEANIKEIEELHRCIAEKI